MSIYLSSMSHPSLVPTPRAPPGEKRSGKWSRISWAYSPKRWKTNEIVRSLITSLTLKFIHLHSSIRTFFEWVFCKKFWTLLGYNVTKVPASPRNSTWFTRPFLLMRGWGLGTRLEPSLLMQRPSGEVTTTWRVKMHQLSRMFDFSEGV